MPIAHSSHDATITVAQAAAAAGMSVSWARDRALYGQLEAVVGTRPLRVTKASLEQLLLDLKRERFRKTMRGSRRKKKPHLRLVIDNT